jgi:hypothetical protein
MKSGNKGIQSHMPPSSAGMAGDQAIYFSVTTVLLSLLLQRFALPIGELPLSAVAPLGLLCGVFWLLRGSIILDQRRLLALFVLFIVGCAGGLISLNASTARVAVVSWPSLVQFLLLSSFATLSFRETVDENRFFAAIMNCIAFVGIAGIFQFFAQFFGFDLFSFVTLGFPERFTLEPYYVIYNPAGVGNVYKSNGFFLMEASIYSQIMALGFAIEILYFRRAQYLAILALGLVISVSGTGWMVFGAFIIGVVARLGVQGALIGTGAIVSGALALSILAFALPDLFDYFIGRVDEFSSPGSSAHIRFISPWWTAGEVLTHAPWALVIGAGAGVSERLQVTYLYAPNSLVKILTEYGLTGLCAYLSLFFVADRTPRQSALLLPAMVLFFFTGGSYSQFAPILFPILLVCSVARLRPPTTAIPGP